MAGTMVACLGCKSVVWAYDQELGDVRLILNMMRMPCRLCGALGSYDGWSVSDKQQKDRGGMSGWQVMHGIAAMEGLEWKASPTNEWFTDGPARRGRTALATLDALKVLARTPATQAFLRANDPMGLKQAESAIAQATGISLNEDARRTLDEVGNCLCYHTCETDSHSGRWHQHEDEPCPSHPEAPVVG